MTQKKNRNIIIFLLVYVILPDISIKAQFKQTLSLQQVVDSAYANNHLLKVAYWQVKEKESKVTEIGLKAIPTVLLSANYIYNHNIGKLVVDEGALGSISLGTLGTFPLPLEKTRIPFGDHHFFNVGAFLYQPLSQQFKIRSGVEAARADVQVSETELDKARQEIRIGVEQLYYGILINRKQTEEAVIRVELVRMQLYDLESALIAGEAVIPDKAGLEAQLADKEKDLIKLRIDRENYWSQLKQLTGLADEAELIYPDVPEVHLLPLSDYIMMAKTNNTDIRILEKEEKYAGFGKKATQQNYIPDIGLFGGYGYIKGFDLFSDNSAIVGVNFSWNLQKLVSNKQSVHQLDAKIHQVKEKRMDTELQVNSQVESTYRNINYTRKLIEVALREVTYREEDLKVKENKLSAGLTTQREVMEASADLAKATSDLFAAQLGYILAYHQLMILSNASLSYIF